MPRYGRHMSTRLRYVSLSPHPFLVYAIMFGFGIYRSYELIRARLAIQLHPWCQQRTIDAYCKQHGIIVEAYSPIVRNYKANDPTLVEVAQKYNHSTQQVLIRYALQKGWVPLPKTDNPDRITSNADVFGFNISAEDMDILDSLDQGDAGAIVEAVANE
jgi:diketogulonate reductase-like aldo/keto reductase